MFTPSWGLLYLPRYFKGRNDFSVKNATEIVSAAFETNTRRFDSVLTNAPSKLSIDFHRGTEAESNRIYFDDLNSEEWIASCGISQRIAKIRFWSPRRPRVVILNETNILFTTFFTYHTSYFISQIDTVVSLVATHWKCFVGLTYKN